MPNWDDQFDFEDLQGQKKKKKLTNKANVNKAVEQQEDFFDNDEAYPKKTSQSILPNINSRNSAKIKSPAQQNNPKQNPYADKTLGSKQVNLNEYEDYYNEDIQGEVTDIKPLKKPNSKQIVKPSKDKGNNSSNLNKSNISDEYNEDLYEQDLQEPLQQIKQNNPISVKVEKQVQKTEQKVQLKVVQQQKQKADKLTAPKPLFGQIKSASPVNQSKPTPKQAVDQYEDQFQNDQYANYYFDEDVESPIKSQAIQKKKQNVIKTQVKSKNLTVDKPAKNKQAQIRSRSEVPPKPPVDKMSNKVVSSNRNINKIQSQSVNKKLVRTNSRSSIRSNQQKNIQGSRITRKNQSDYFPNKHADLVDRSFPQDEIRLNSLSPNQINKMNQKMRAMIRKFNEELNDLINKNMLLLKNKSQQKQSNLEERINQLKIQKKSGETAIEVMEKDFDKLHGREGQLKEQEYQLILEKKIQEMKVQIKQVLKLIHLLKRQVDTKGKKLSIKDEERNAQNIHQIKTILIQTKKDEQKGDQRIQKLVAAQQQLETKISDMEYKLDELISQAKQKGINIENTDTLMKKYQECKLKLQNFRNYNKKSQNLINTKIDILNHENEQIKITIRNTNSQINNFYGSIDHSQNQSIKMIEKAKQKFGVNPLFAQSLQKLLNQIEQSKANNDYFQARSEVKSRRSDSSRNRSIKNSHEENIQKSMPLRVNQNQNKIIDNEQISVKPKFLKKKIGQEAKINAQSNEYLNQRVWNQQEEINIKATTNDENRIAVENFKKDSLKQIREPVIEQKTDKSKPFSLKKNKNQQKDDQKQLNSSKQIKTNELTKDEPNLEVNERKNQTNSQQKLSISIVPRMMRFGKKKNNDQAQTKNQIVVDQYKSAQNNQTKLSKLNGSQNQSRNNNQSLKIDTQAFTNGQGQKPIFVPKRFNLKSKAQKKDDSYTPSVQTDANNTQKVKTPVEQQKEQYKPKFDFKKEEHQAKQQARPGIVQKMVANQQLQLKPRFNLRLRDRMKQDTKQQYVYGNDSSAAKNINESLNAANNSLKIDKMTTVKQQNKVLQKESPYVPPKIQQSNPYAPRPQILLNPYAPKPNENLHNPREIVKNSNSQQLNVMDNQKYVIENQPKRERGPLKKNKLSVNNAPKQSFNIYAQAQEIAQVPTIGGRNLVQNVIQPAINISNKKQELNLNEMLGIKKQQKNNDFDDLLGNLGPIGSKNKKKNNDFFGDLDL